MAKPAVIFSYPLFSYPREFPADSVEVRVLDHASARALVAARRPDVLVLLDKRRKRLASAARGEQSETIERAEDAILIAFCRLAFRHGSWGEDFHAYHNEGHILEILGPRLDRMMDSIGDDKLSLRDWFRLSLFAAAHDLRQRETPEFHAGIGSNERASVEETFRILRICGFTPEQNSELFLSCELMISGSTFDARPPASTHEYNPAELVVQSGGALAHRLEAKLDKHVPAWRGDARIQHALELALIAADLDTANVAEPFDLFMASAERLCIERELRSRRDLGSPASAQPVLTFLTEGQERYFFELHRFNSAYGRKIFESAKRANADRLMTVTTQLRAQFATEPPRDGVDVLAAFRRLVKAA
jgi:hypothetical protein